MRSDFWSLPYAAQQAIRRGEHAASRSRGQARSIGELEAKVDELEKALAAANEKVAAYEVMASSDGVREAGQALYDAIGAWSKPTQGWFTPEIIAAGEKWCALTQSSVQPK